MNNQTSSGDSANQTTVLDGSAFGITGEAAKTSPQTEANTQQENSEIIVEDKEEENKEESETKDDSEIKSLRKKADESHRVVLDVIGEKLQALEKKQLTDLELREWFDTHPHIAEKANRSKKYKDQFRALMERDQATQYDSDLKAKRESQIKDEGTDDDEDDKGFKGDKDVATKSDIKKLLEEHTRQLEEKMLESSLKKSRQNDATDFAAENGINEENFDKFFKTADAIYQVNDEMEFDQALQAAYGAIYGSKPKPVNVSSKGASRDTGALTGEVEKIMAQHGLTKDIAAELVASGKTAATIDLSKGIPLMSMKNFR